MVKIKEKNSSINALAHFNWYYKAVAFYLLFFMFEQQIFMLEVTRNDIKFLMTIFVVKSYWKIDLHYHSIQNWRYLALDGYKIKKVLNVLKWHKLQFKFLLE